MSDVVLARGEEMFRAPSAAAGSSLMTPLALIEGEVLTYLERDGTTTLRRLIRELEWPARMVMMGVGALVREGLVRATKRELEVLLTPVQQSSAP